MVCNTCRRAGRALLGNPKRAAKLHGKCLGGTHCDCQHSVEQSYIQMEHRRDITEGRPEVQAQAD